MPEPMTEAKVAELEAEWRQLVRGAEKAAQENQARITAGDHPFVGLGHFSAQVAADAEREYLDARAQLEQQRREQAESESAEMLASNRRMAEATEAAARASADAARWAKWAAIFTAIATLASLAAAVLQERARG